MMDSRELEKRIEEIEKDLEAINKVLFNSRETDRSARSPFFGDGMVQGIKDLINAIRRSK